MEQKVTSHITKGLIIALIIIVISVIGHLTNLALENWFGWISMCVFLAGVIWATIFYGKQMNNNVTFGSLFAHGFKVSAVVTCLVYVFTVLSIYLLFPDFIDKVIDKGMEEARKKGSISDDQLEKGMAMARKIVPITILAGVVILNLIIGAVASLIGAGIAKKNPQDPFTQQPM